MGSANDRVDADIAHRKRTQARLTEAGAVIGLGALAARGGGMAARRVLKPTAKAVSVQRKINAGTNVALAVGGGVGGASGLYSARTTRMEAAKELRKQPVAVQKGLGGDLKVAANEVGRGMRAASTRYSGGVRQRTVRVGEKTAGNRKAFRAGVALHDLGSGLSRRTPSGSEVRAGLVTTSSTASNKAAFQVGQQARRYGSPAVLVGGGYYTGRQLRGSKGKSVSKSAFGVNDERIEKNAQRMGAQEASWSGHLPKHTAGAVAAKKSAFQAGIEMPGHTRPVKAGLRTARALKPYTKVLAKSAFGVEDERVEKSYDPEARRHARAGAAAGAAGIGAAAGAALAGHQGLKAKRSFQAALKPATAAVKLRAATKSGLEHSGKAGAALAGGAAAALTGRAIVRHQSKLGRSYDGWYNN